MMSYQKLYIIYVKHESLIEKIHGCANNSQKSSTTEIGNHIPYRYPLLTIWALNQIENKHSLYNQEILYEKVLYFPKRTCCKCN